VREATLDALIELCAAIREDAIQRRLNRVPEWMRSEVVSQLETRARMRAFREACEIITKMWTEDYPEFAGETYTIDKPINEPKGVRTPHPSFWIGGGGEQVTLKLVARFGDASNLGGNVDPAVVEHKLEILRQHCDTVGRDYNSIIKSTSVEDIVLVKPGETPEAAVARQHGAMAPGFVGTAEELVERIQALVARGINYVIVSFPRLAYDHEPLHRFAAEVAPLVNS